MRLTNTAEKENGKTVFSVNTPVSRPNMAESYISFSMTIQSYYLTYCQGAVKRSKKEYGRRTSVEYSNKCEKEDKIRIPQGLF